VSDAGRITVGIASRDRAESLVRCINSLSFVDDRIAEVIVVDDGSAVPVESLVRAGIRPPAANKLTVVRHESSGGLAAARNEIAQRARSRWVLMLDDDAALLSAHAVTAGIDAIAADDRVLAIAFAQADAEGKAWPPGAQPGAASYPCRVPTFIGFAHLLRRDAFIALGGYRAQILINGEEGELCLRALDAGWDIVFLPDALIAHLIDPAGRNLRRYLHLVVRNGCLASIYNDPFLLMCVRTPMRLASYFRMRAGWHVDDPWGFLAILRWLLRDLPQAVRLRHAVRWSTIRRWRQLARRSPAYRAPA
jgi:GT2 family glycosyltransferase